ncbi:inactive protein kinase SELMODRAFT_444075 [Eucalyptus grandis]|uniref:inactive protein kinase SELMODRAFT_444075 n=1 Tax=Eucalyptus grandis TaxID=71139 RepID=UPI00192F11A4|nr:inactive protein kinase SELMODRAFT_444075 [Eucalyptus grandis]
MKDKGSSDGVGNGKVVVVAVKASREIPRAALAWTLTHVAQPGDCIKLLVVISHSSSKKMWMFSKFASDCTTGHHRSISEISLDEKDDIANSCSEMMYGLHNVYDPDKVKVRLKIVSNTPCGVVAAEAKRVHSNWVILDKRLKHEKQVCIDELQCNLVVMERSKAKVLRLNLIGSPGLDSETSPLSLVDIDVSHVDASLECEDMIRGPLVTPASSPEHESPSTTTDIGTSSISSSDQVNSPFLLSEVHRKLQNEYIGKIEVKRNFEYSDSDVESEKLGPPAMSWLEDTFNPLEDKSPKPDDKAFFSTYESLMDQISNLERDPDRGINFKLDMDISRSVREAISLSRNAPPTPPPLCSVCRHKAPVFGNPPRWFSYSELELATGAFSRANFLAEGGYGSVHRGVLPDGQVIAVKQHKSASSQGDVEFCAEVEVLSCAQHRNLVTLIGFCVEDGRRLLVYEYICNGSLDSHLYGRDRDPLSWCARQKIAVGAARGLRYLHEECRVGCIVHRDLRPNNILLTHDFEPLVGDFGLARWQPDGDMGVETRVIGTFGYLAPEYAQSGQITEKADVYSFGVVLVELVTGRKAMDIKRPKGQQCLTEWARPLLERRSISELIDPNLNNCYSEQEVHRMLKCASLCIRRDPQLRPRMSQVLRMLESDTTLN